MGRMRVHELAKELNLTNKAILDKIAKMDNIKVSSHMSALEKDEIKAIRDFIMGVKEKEEESRRVQPSVIRRRKNRPENEMILQEETPEIPEEKEESVPPEKKEQKAEPVLPPEDEKDKEPAAEEAAHTEPSPDNRQEKTPVSQPKKKVKKTTPAKVISRPAAEIKPSPDKAEDTVTAANIPTETPVSVEENPVIAENQHVEPEIVQKTAEAAQSSVQNEVPPIPPVSEMPKEEPKTASTEDTETKPEQAPRKKKSTAAKIIKRIDPAFLQQTRQDRHSESPRPVREREQPKVQDELEQLEKMLTSTSGPPTDTPSSGSRKKKGKTGPSKDFAEMNEDERFKSGKKKSKRRSIIEGEALYQKDKKGKKQEVHQKTQITVPKAVKRRIKVDDTIVLSELAKRMGIKASLMIQKLMMLGVMATVNQTIDYDTAVLVASEFGFEVEKASFEEENILTVHEDKPEELVSRAPVVTVMGHVDHGKTSLLDTIRKTRVVVGEAGGITQHIGAYSVETDQGMITFLDTPGHEAFTSMRSRGAQITDIVVLVVAADDGVMPQTVEAINHAKAANVPSIVAINKMDKPGAEPDRVKRELSEKGILAEDWGGDTIFTYVSAKANTGIDELLSMILLQAEVLDLKANPNKNALGHVVEAKLDTGRGPVATILVQDGTLRTGDAIVCGIHYGKIRAMINDKGETVHEAGPSIPVEILGLSGVPEAGDELVALKDEKDARQVSQHRAQKQRANELAKTSRMSLEKLFEQMEEGEVKELNLILKADVQGSIEALRESLTKMSTPQVKIRIVHAATGTITESDITLAAVSNAIILGFNVRPAGKVHDLAKEEHVDMRFYNIIYDALKDIQNAMMGMMDSTFDEKVLGRAEIRQTFIIPKVGTIAGCFVLDGTIYRNQKVRLLRDGVILYDGKLSSLKRFKDDVREVNRGYECGMAIEHYNDVKVGDVIECYEIIEIRPTLA